MTKSTALEVDANEAHGWARVCAYTELGKVRLSGLAVFAVVAGYLFAVPTPDWTIVSITALGTMLVAMGGNAANMYYERDLDAKMDRTKGRPIPTGRLTPEEVLAFAWGTAVVGLVILAIATNLLATSICALIFVSYVWIYTPLKVKTSLNTIVGAVPGALPPVVGYTAAGAAVDINAAVLFLILFFWQIPHFLAIAWRYREDYRRGGYKMLPCTDPSGRSTSWQMLLYTNALFIATFMPYYLGMAGEIYLGSMVCLNVLFMVPAFLAAIFRWESAMAATFKVSIIYLPLLLSIMVLDLPAISH